MREEIEGWLKQYKVENYNLIPNDEYGFVVDVKNNVSLFNKKIYFIPVKFNKVSGYFSCSNNQLTSLEFCPSVVDGSFNCSYNSLVNLKDGPIHVGGDFNCNDNRLTSLEFCPNEINGNFNCSNNKLTSLRFCPEEVNGYFYCNNNKLNSVEFCPEYVGGSFYCNDNRNLGDLQKENDFKKIYQVHRDFISKLEYEKLHNIIRDNNVIKKNKI